MKARHVLTRPHPLTIVVVFSALVASTVTGTHPAQLAAGALAWSLVEYVVHRWVLHGLTGRAYDFVHGGHHRKPLDARRAVVPLTHSGAVGAVLFFAARALDAPDVFAGVAVGYLAFEIVHVTMHSRFRRLVPTALRRHHARHHYVDERAAFGVTTRFWDFVFRTMPHAPHPFAVCESREESEAL